MFQFGSYVASFRFSFAPQFRISRVFVSPLRVISPLRLSSRISPRARLRSSRETSRVSEFRAMLDLSLTRARARAISFGN